MKFLSPYQRARLLLLLAAAGAFTIGLWAGRLLHVPPHAGRQASLMLTPGSAMNVLAAVLATLLAAALGTGVAGIIRFNAGLLTGCVALGALAFRGGNSRYTWQHALAGVKPATAFLVFAIETVFLGLLLGAVWWTLRSLHVAGKLKDRETELMLDTPEHETANELTAFGVQFTVTAVGVLLLAQSDAKIQVIAAVFVGSFAGSAIAHSVFSTGPRSWYWLPPLALAAVSYAVAAISPPTGIDIADPRGPFVGLVRPLPLDYASAGVAGAVMGHWMSRRWQKEREAVAAANTAQGQSATG